MENKYKNRYFVGLRELPACGVTAVNGDADEACPVGLIFPYTMVRGYV